MVIKKNNKGNITLVALVGMLLLSSLAVIHVWRLQKHRRDIKNRNQVYLCFKYLGKTTKDHLEAMATLNLTIRTAFIGTLSPEPSTQTAMRTLWNTSKLAQELLHISYLKNLSRNDFCKSTQSLEYVMRYPFKRSGIILSRLPDGTVPLKYKEWTVRIMSKTIVLQGRYKMTSAFNPRHSLFTHEMGLPSLKVFSGFQFSPSLPSL
jgi:hypothetical protein